MSTDGSPGSPGSPAATAPTQAQRRLKFGLNVAVGVLAALGLALLINLLSFKYLTRLKPWDLTATGQYSLAPQTRKVLESLHDDYRIVTLFGSSDPTLGPDEIQRAQDLVDQYARACPRLHVEHISADTQVSQSDAFLGQLRDRYAAALAPYKDALDQSSKDLEALREPVQEQKALLTATATDPALAGADFAELKQLLQVAVQAFGRLDAGLDTLQQDLGKSLKTSLPAYADARTSLEDTLVRLNDKLYRPLIDGFKKAVANPALPAATKERLLNLIDRFTKTQATLETAQAALHNAQDVPEYEQMRQQLNANANPLVIVGPGQVRVLWLGNMFPRDPKARQAQTDTPPERLFQGEERITGALFAMGLEKLPLVVFVSTGPTAATGASGGYQQAADRLRDLNFDVQDWTPGGQTTAQGQRLPPGPPPQPAPGQKAVWILLPSTNASPFSFGPSQAEQQAVAHVEQRLAQGDAAMLIVTYAPAQQFNDQPAPVVKVMDQWGITAQLDRVILRQITGPDGQPHPQAQLDVSRWPTELPVSQALAGLRGLFVQASPLALKPDPAHKLSVWPLAELTGPDLWAEHNLEDAANVRRDPQNASDRYIVAAAAQKDQARLIAVADPAWASDSVLDYGALGQGTASFTASMFPANAELFVNSIEWLAGLDNLIAATARTQDIRRVQALSPAAMSTITWGLLAGLPALALLGGLGVWMVRRKA